MEIKSLDELRELANGGNVEGDIENENNAEKTESTEESSVPEESSEPSKDDENTGDSDVESVSEGSGEGQTEEEEPKEEEVEDKESTEETVEEETPEEFDYTYKSMGEVIEFDDFIKSAIKTKEDEEAVRRLYQKSKGLEVYEKKYETVKEERDSLKEEAEIGKNLRSEIDYYNTLIKNGDHTTFFKTIGLTDENILRAAQQILQYNDLTPEQQQAYNNNIQSTQDLYRLRQQNQMLQNQIQTSDVAAQAASLDGALNSEDVAHIMQEYDAQRGKVGAFREEVINRAALLESQTASNPNGATILSPDEAIDAFLQVIGKARGVKQEAPAAPAENNSQPRVISKKPTIPNIANSGKSPVKQIPRSLDELRALADASGDF